MSELKAFECRIYWPVEQGVDEADDIDLFYLKSEADKVIRHYKYKRCLAMAKMCEERSERYFSWSKKMDFILKWKLRWLELAEKFKEAK